MEIDFFNLRKNYLKNGYVVCKNIFNENYVNKLIKEIDKSKDTVKYFDNQNNLRRIEKLYDKGTQLKNLNLPEEMRVGAVLRDNKVIIPRSSFTFKKDDKVVFIAKKDSISFVENIFRLSSV